MDFVTVDTGGKLVGQVVENLPDSVATATSDTSFTGSSALSSSDDFYNGTYLRFVMGQNAGIRRQITDYTGSTKTFTFTEVWPVAPRANEDFVIEEAPVDLTGGSVVLRYSLDGGSSTEVTMTVDSATTGDVSYQWLTADLGSDSVDAEGEITVTDSGSKTTTSEPFRFRVRARLP